MRQVNRKYFLLGLGVLAAVVVFYLVFFYPWSKMVWKSTSSVATVESAPKYFSALDGRMVSSTADERPQVLGIMIDNYPGVEQSGLNEAKVVYEAPVEGGATRYLAIFEANQTITKVGPVRSARPYYIDWMSEYGGAPYLHCGGSPAALEILQTTDKVTDINEFYNGKYFWRDTDLEAPHNLFTNSEAWQKIIENEKIIDSDWRGWQFDRSFNPSVSSSIKEITIQFSPFYSVSWRYDAAAKKWLRYKNSKAQLDEKDKQIDADNLVIEETRMEILDDIGREEVQTVGQGDVRVLRMGELARGVWKKEDKISRTRFFDENENELKLVPGDTWVEVVPTGAAVEVTK